MKSPFVTLAFCFFGTFLLPAHGFAADALTAEQRLEDLYILYCTLEERHPNLYANTPAAVFQEKRDEIAQALEKRDDFGFLLDLQSLTALAGDSHTTVSLSGAADLHLYPFGLAYYDDKPLLNLVHKDNRELLGLEILAVGGIPVAELERTMAAVISHDNEVKLRRQFKQMVYLAEALQYFGVCEPGEALTLTLADAAGWEIRLVLPQLGAEEQQSIAEDYLSLSELRQSVPVTEFNRGEYYFARPLNDAAYYIQYNRCAEDENLPMAAFCEQVRADLGAGSYDRVLVDLRYNGGGSDGVLVPLIALLRQQALDGGLKLFCLVDEITYSSAIINSMMLKEAGAILVGAPTSGSVDHFGSVGNFSLSNSGVRVNLSSKFIDMGDFLSCGHAYGVESLVPDYPAPETLADYLAGIDTTVEYILAQGDNLNPPDQDQAPLTRGIFIDQLWRKAMEYGKGAESGECESFYAFPFAVTTPAVEWAFASGVASFYEEAEFLPALLISDQEIAALLSAFTEYLGQPIDPEAKASANGQSISVRQGRELVERLFPGQSLLPQS